jgi:hypothetical protein
MPPTVHSSSHSPAAPSVSQSKPATGQDTVIVACRLPHGLWLRRFVPQEESEHVLGGGVRTVKVYRETGERFRIAGNAMLLLRVPDGKYPEIISGAALTFGVPADLWESWLAANKDSPMVREGLVRAVPNYTDARSYAQETRDVKSGLEPLERDGDPRMPSGVTRTVANDA